MDKCRWDGLHDKIVTDKLTNKKDGNKRNFYKNFHLLGINHSLQAHTIPMGMPWEYPRSPCWHTEFSMVTHHGTWGPFMSLVDGHCVLPEPIGWLCLHLDCPPSAADLFRLPPLKSGTLYRNTSSQPSRCSPSGVTWKRFYCNNISAYSIAL